LRSGDALSIHSNPFSEIKKSQSLLMTREGSRVSIWNRSHDPKSQTRDLGHPSVVTDTVGHFALDLPQASRLLGMVPPTSGPLFQYDVRAQSGLLQTNDDTQTANNRCR
jgi:hypothetical protein